MLLFEVIPPGWGRIRTAIGTDRSLCALFDFHEFHVFFLVLGGRWAEMKEGEPCTTLGALEFTGGCTGPEKTSALHDSAL